MKQNHQVLTHLNPRRFLISLGVQALIGILMILAYVSSPHYLRAASATGQFSLFPNSAVLSSCNINSVSVQVLVSGAESSAADLILVYDPNKIEVVDTLTGNAYSSHGVNRHDPNSGKIWINGFTASGQKFSGAATFATINFKALPGVNSAGIQVLFNGVGNTLDSNIADATTSLDILNKVTHGSYTFSSSGCDQINPQPGSTVDEETQNSGTTSSPTSTTTPKSPTPTPPKPKSTNPNISSTKVNYTLLAAGRVLTPTKSTDVIRGEAVELIGKAGANQKIEVVVRSDPIVYETISNARGEWRLAFSTRKMELGTHTVEVFVTDQNGRIVEAGKKEFLVVSGGVISPDVSQLRPGGLSDNLVALLLGGFGILLAIIGFILTIQVRRMEERIKKKH